MAVDGHKDADFNVDNYAALNVKLPRKENCSVPDPTDIDCFSTLEFFVTRLSCPSATALVQGWIAFRPKF